MRRVLLRLAADTLVVAAALLAAVPLGLLVARIALEEGVLRRELPGYREYAARVPYRLLPGVW